MRFVSGKLVQIREWREVAEGIGGRKVCADLPLFEGDVLDPESAPPERRREKKKLETHLSARIPVFARTRIAREGSVSSEGRRYEATGRTQSTNRGAARWRAPVGERAAGGGERESPLRDVCPRGRVLYRRDRLRCTSLYGTSAWQRLSTTTSRCSSATSRITSPITS